MARLQKNRFKVRWFSRAVAFANWLATIPNRLMPPPFRLLQIGSAFWQSRALFVAVKLGLADEIGDSEKHTEMIAAALGLHEDHLYRLMRMLASIGVFKETSYRVFKNSKLSAALRSDNPQNVREIILMHNSAVMTHPWFDSLELGIRTGNTPFAVSHGRELFGYMDEHADFDALFSRAMDAVEGLTGLDYLHDFDWNRFDRIIDIGGSKGTKAWRILQANPQLEALVFDRRQVIESAPAYWREQGEEQALKRMQFVAGDMFESIPSARSERDLYLCIALFHSLDDADAARVLENLKRAFGEQRPLLLVMDCVADETGIDPAVAAFDMQMLIGTHGRERTLVEWQSLFRRSGFVIREVVEVRTFAKCIVVEYE